MVSNKRTTQSVNGKYWRIKKMIGEVVSVNISKNKGERKKPVTQNWEVIRGCGLKDDGHANLNCENQDKTSHRQVSLLAIESIEKMRKRGLEVGPGDFAENITTAGINLLLLKVGSRIKIAQEVVLEISQIGKVCHNRCAIYYQAGDCVMPTEGIFARVINGGMIKPKDKIQIID